MPPKPDLVFNNAPNDVETNHPTFNVKLRHTKPNNALAHTHRPPALIIEDWVSNSEDESKAKTPHNVPSFVQPPEQPIHKNSTIPPKVTAAKATMVNAAQGTCLIYLILRSSMVDMLPLVMCDKKNSVLFTDTECLVLSHEFKLPDENQVLLRVPRENNLYNVDLKHIDPSGDLTCLFAKATLDESNFWHRRLGHINFKIMNKLVKEKAREEIVQQYVLFPVWSSSSTNPQNTDGDAAFDEKDPESEVNVSLSSSAQSKKHDDKTKREAKGKS
nr:ribonuclease H-like domain-containing protein [Tanacetum cinerariifolium]